MGIFGQRRSEAWHKNIDTTAAGKFPANATGTADETFPWAQLRLQTDIYLSKKSKLTPEGQASRLLALIEKHEVKSRAIAAAAHLLASETVRNLLTAEAVVTHDEKDFALHNYLQAIIASKRVNPWSVTDIEVHCAEVLISFCTSTKDATSYLYPQALLQLLMIEGVSSDMLLYPTIRQLAVRACSVFAQQLESPWEDRYLQRAYVATRWLVTVRHRSLETSLDQGAEALLDDAFPAWRCWAAWQPDVNRLHLWADLTIPNRAKLRHLLALEGPDFLSGSKPTLAEGIASDGDRGALSIIHSGDLSLQLKDGSTAEVREMIFRLLRAVDDASQRRQQTVSLLEHFCDGKAIDHESLNIIESVNIVRNAAVDAAVLEVLSKPSEAGVGNVGAVIRLLLLLGTGPGHGLRGLLAPVLAQHVSSRAEGMQREVSRHLDDTASWVVRAAGLLSFGRVLKEAMWIQPLLDANLQNLLRHWPEREDVMTLQAIRSNASNGNITGLDNLLQRYLRHRLVEHQASDHGHRLVENLIRFWQQVRDETLQKLALILFQTSSSSPGFDELYGSLLIELPSLPSGFSRSLLQILTTYNGEAGVTVACVDMARLLVSAPSSVSMTFWRPLLRRMLETHKDTLIEQALQELSAESWLQWMENLGEIFGDTFSNPFSRPAIPSESLFSWVQCLSEYRATIQWLETNLDSRSAISCILIGGDEDNTLASRLVAILEFFKKTAAGRYSVPMQKTLALLSGTGNNAQEVCIALSSLVEATPDGLSACERVLELSEHTSKYVAEAVLSGWLHASDLGRVDKLALENLSHVLGVGTDLDSLIPMEAMNAATTYFDEQMAGLLEESRRLDGLRMALAAQDPEGTVQLLASLDIQSPSLVEDAFALLPSALVDVVEIIGDREVEIQFPLTHLSALQRKAMGAEDSNNLLVRLVLGDSSMPPGFCMHFDNEALATDHSPWILFEGSTAPNKRYCGAQANRCVYQLSRALFRHWLGQRYGLEEIHTFLTTAIRDMAHNCLVCGTPHAAKLRRSTICFAPDCTMAFNQSDLDFRLSDTRQDPAMVDVLLTMAYSAAATNNYDLLPGFPRTEAMSLTKLLDKLSPMTDLQTRDLLYSLNSLEVSLVRLLIRVSHCYRGFLMSATEKLRIPSLPGCQQFLLANAAPELEAAFAKHRRTPSQTSTVLFHGTTMDRLYAILCQGLLVCSDSPLRRNGSSYGKGIYMAEEPATAWSYSNKSNVVTKSWNKGAFHDLNVVLGCEYLGTKARVAQGIHVITDPSTLMLRYIFLVPAGTKAPPAGHVVPAMLSAFAQLR